MIIFHQARKQIGLIASLLGQSADAAWWEIGLADGLVIFLIVPKAIWGYKYGKENLVRILINDGSSDCYKIKELFNEEINRGNERAKNVFDEVMKLSGLD